MTSAEGQAAAQNWVKIGLALSVGPPRVPMPRHLPHQDLPPSTSGASPRDLIKALGRPRVTRCKKFSCGSIFFLHARQIELFIGVDALARAYGPSGLCNDGTRPFWIVWRTLVP